LKLSVSVLNDEEHTSSCFTVKSAKMIKTYADWVHRVKKTFNLLCPLREKIFTFEVREEKIDLSVTQFAKIHGHLYLDNGLTIAKHKPMKLRRACSRLLYLWAALVRNGWTCKSLRNALERPVVRHHEKKVKIAVKKQQKKGVYETACEKELEKYIEKNKSRLANADDLRRRLNEWKVQKQVAVSKLRNFALKLKPSYTTFGRAVMHCAYFSAKNRAGMNDFWKLESLGPDKNDEKIVDVHTMQKWKWCFNLIKHSNARLGKAKDLLHNKKFWLQVVAMSKMNEEIWDYILHLDKYAKSKKESKVKVEDVYSNINYLLKEKARKNDFRKKFLGD